MARVHTVDLAVRYVETDRMQVVHHSAYLAWFEIARTSLLAEAGFPYHELERSGVLFPVVEYSCRLTGSSDYGDVVHVDAWVRSLRSRAVVFAYETSIDGVKITSGSTSHVAVNADLRTRRMPADLIEALTPFVNSER